MHYDSIKGDLQSTLMRNCTVNNCKPSYISGLSLRVVESPHINLVKSIKKSSTSKTHSNYPNNTSYALMSENSHSNLPYTYNSASPVWNSQPNHHHPLKAFRNPLNDVNGTINLFRKIPLYPFPAPYPHHNQQGQLAVSASESATRSKKEKSNYIKIYYPKLIVSLYV